MYALSPSIAIKRFFEKDSAHGPIATAEFFQFWKALSTEEKAEFAQISAKELKIKLAVEEKN